MMGSLKCVCEKSIKDHGSITTYKKEFTYTYLGKTKTTTYCKPYLTDFYKEKAFNNGVKYMIIALNTFIRMGVIYIITKIGCSTESN